MKSLPSVFACGLLMLPLMRAAAAQDQPEVAEVPTVSYCQLIVNPEQYDKRLVRIEATYIVAYEVAALEDDPTCHDGGGRNIGVRFTDSYQSQTDKSVLKKFRDLIKVRRNKWGVMRKVKVTLVGIFNGEKEKITYGNKVVTPLYDGLCKYQLVVARIEAAHKL